MIYYQRMTSTQELKEISSRLSNFQRDTQEGRLGLNPIDGLLVFLTNLMNFNYADEAKARAEEARTKNGGTRQATSKPPSQSLDNLTKRVTDVKESLPRW